MKNDILVYSSNDNKEDLANIIELSPDPRCMYIYIMDPSSPQCTHNYFPCASRLPKECQSSLITAAKNQSLTATIITHKEHTSMTEMS
jgi:hypothetical protein